jgi:hypothetical protein
MESPLTNSEKQSLLWVEPSMVSSGRRQVPSHLWRCSAQPEKLQLCKINIYFGTLQGKKSDQNSFLDLETFKKLI